MLEDTWKMVIRVRSRRGLMCIEEHPNTEYIHNEYYILLLQNNEFEEIIDHTGRSTTVPPYSVQYPTGTAACGPHVTLSEGGSRWRISTIRGNREIWVHGPECVLCTG
jgi:hypothetical protein